MTKSHKKRSGLLGGDGGGGGGYSQTPPPTAIPKIKTNLLNPKQPLLIPFPPALRLPQCFRGNPHCHARTPPLWGMRDKDKSISNTPTKSNPEGNGVAGQGFVHWVVDEDGKGVVGEGDLDCFDGGGDIFGGD